VLLQRALVGNGEVRRSSDDNGRPNRCPRRTRRAPARTVRTHGDRPMIHVLAIITAKPGMRERILQAFRENVEAVRAEAGCLSYEAVIDVRDASPGFASFGPDTFVVVEKWQSMQALQAHAVAPHMKAYAGKVKEFTANRAIHVLEPA
jgi:quinol monooxygenase YgiN